MISSLAPRPHLTSTWKAQVDRWIDAAPVVDQDRVFVVSYLHRAYAFDAKNGAKQWQIDIGENLTEPVKVAQDNTVILTSRTNSGNGFVAYGVDRDRGTKLWERPLPTGTFQAGPWVNTSGACFAADGSGNLNRLEARTGQSKWSHAVGDNSRFWFTGFGADTIYGAITGKDPGICDTSMVAIDSNSGQQRWSLPIGLSGDWAIQPLQDGHALVTSFIIPGSHQPSRTLLQKVDPKDGASDWKWQEENCSGRATVGKHGRIFLGQFDRQIVTQTHLVCLDEKSGATLWKTDTDGHSVQSVREGADGTVYAMTAKYAQQGQSNMLYAVDGASGQVKWRRPLDGKDMHDLHIGTNGELLDLYVAFTGYGESGTSILTRLAPTDGKPLWQDHWDKPVMSVVKGPDGTVYLDLGTHLAAVDPNDGKQIADYSNGAWVHVNSQLQSRGQLFVTDHDGHITALEAASPTQSADPQPSPDGIPGGWHMLGTDRHGSASILEAGGFLAVDADDCGHYNAAKDFRILQGSQSIDKNTLASLDQDHNGLLQGAELSKAGLSLWLDKNGNGRVDPGEPVAPLTGDADTETVIDLDTMRLEQAITVHD